MCDPFTMTALQVGAGFIGENQAAKDQEAMNAENAKSARSSAFQQYADVGLRIAQETMSGTTEKMETQREVRQAQATAAVAGGEAGVSGNSLMAVLGEFAGRGGQFNAGIDQQRGLTVSQLVNSTKGIQAQATDRINSAKVVSRPSFLDAGLRIGGAWLDTRADKLNAAKE